MLMITFCNTMLVGKDKLARSRLPVVVLRHWQRVLFWLCRRRLHCLDDRWQHILWIPVYSFLHIRGPRKGEEGNLYNELIVCQGNNREHNKTRLVEEITFDDHEWSECLLTESCTYLCRVGVGVGRGDSPIPNLTRPTWSDGWCLYFKVAPKKSNHLACTRFQI